MTLAARDADRSHGNGVPARGPERPVEVWPTSAIRSALQDGDISVWQRIVLAIKRDPFGRTARQVEEVLANAELIGVSKAMHEVIARSRQHLEANERAEAARHIRVLMDRSGLSDPEFASRSGIPPQDLEVYLSGKVSPPASLMIRMRRLSDRFAKIQEQRRGRG